MLSNRANKKQLEKKAIVVSIDSCLNNVTQNDAWCFSTRIAEIFSTIYPENFHLNEKCRFAWMRKSHTFTKHVESVRERMRNNIFVHEQWACFPFTKTFHLPHCSQSKHNIHEYIRFFDDMVTHLAHAYPIATTDLVSVHYPTTALCIDKKLCRGWQLFIRIFGGRMGQNFCLHFSFFFHFSI